jgi:hypothetical protein
MQRFFIQRDQVAVAAGATWVTLLELVTDANVPVKLTDITIDVENTTFANSVPTPMILIQALRSSTALTSPTNIYTGLTSSGTGANKYYTASASGITLGSQSPKTTINIPGTENFTAVDNSVCLHRRIPITGSVWEPQMLAREIDIAAGLTSWRIRAFNGSTGAVAASVTFSAQLEE